MKRGDDRYDPKDTPKRRLRPRNAQQTPLTSDDAGEDYSTARLYNPALRCCTAGQRTVPPRQLVKPRWVQTCRILIRCVFTRRKTGAQLAVPRSADHIPGALLPPVVTELYKTTWLPVFSVMEAEKRGKERCP